MRTLATICVVHISIGLSVSHSLEKKLFTQHLTFSFEIMLVKKDISIRLPTDVPNSSECLILCDFKIHFLGNNMILTN